MRFAFSLLTCLAIVLLLFPGLAQSAGPATPLPVSTLALPQSTLTGCACEPGTCDCQHCTCGGVCPCGATKATTQLQGFRKTCLPISTLKEQRFPTPSQAVQQHWLTNGGWRWSDDQGGYWYRVQPAIPAAQPVTYQMSYTPPVYSQGYFGSVANVGFFGGSRGGNCSGGG